MRNLLNRVQLLATACLFVFTFITPSLHARTFSDIVAFGDSLTDHYGLSGIVEESPIGSVPEAWTNCPPTGPCVWVEYMAAQWDADVDNNAIGGAMTEGHENENIEAALPSIDLGLVGQVKRYVSFDPDFDAENTLFTLWIGGNDLLEFFRDEADATNADVLIRNAMGNISEALNELETAGAENFLILSLPDLSKSPYFDFTGAGLQERTEAQLLVQSFNSALESTVDTFEVTHPGVTVYRFNVFSFLNSVIKDGTFENTTGTYLVLDEQGIPTGATNSPAEDYLFWDLIHPTTRAHELLGEAVADKIEDHEDDDDTCFISTTAQQDAGGAAWMSVLGIIAGLSMTALRRGNR